MISYYKIIFCLLLIIGVNIYPQLKLNLAEEEKLSGLTLFNNIKENETAYKKTSAGALPYIYYTMLFINPVIVIEDKKVNFGLTKEISVGYFPFGRLAFEYSYIFREFNTSHLRLSYNYDFILEAGDFAAFHLTPGAGYFTDTHNKGWFGQASFGVILPIGLFVVDPYIKYRHTFINDKQFGKTDIDDISLGMGFLFYLNN